ncbi:hypothetical protein GH714_018324 [Hevea brasiliensis]|uniref:Uncharacterized protein n=1 Tax=Hevea brasiliensis TaxID=3981 RepID=A0A6A6LLD1_HEVBR|nr:hypothetical protein GH714_018324 [Hevea brasiliensis]
MGLEKNFRREGPTIVKRSILKGWVNKKGLMEGEARNWGKENVSPMSIVTKVDRSDLRKRAIGKRVEVALIPITLNPKDHLAVRVNDTSAITKSVLEIVESLEIGEKRMYEGRHLGALYIHAKVDLIKQREEECVANYVKANGNWDVDKLSLFLPIAVISAIIDVPAPFITQGEDDYFFG